MITLKKYKGFISLSTLLGAALHNLQSTIKMTRAARHTFTANKIGIPKLWQKQHRLLNESTGMIFW